VRDVFTFTLCGSGNLIEMSANRAMNDDVLHLASLIPSTRTVLQFPHKRFRSPLPVITGKASPSFGSRTTLV